MAPTRSRARVGKRRVPGEAAGESPGRAERARPAPVEGVRAEPSLGEITLSWEHAPWEPLLDHYAIYAARDSDPPIDGEALLATTVYSEFPHTRLGPEAQRWVYRVVVVDAAGRRGRPSSAVSATTVESVVLRGDPLAEVGAFDGKSLELALAPDGYASYPEEFPDDVDFVYGTHAPGDDWCYIHPGPNDAWAGGLPHTFTLRFDLSEEPAGEVAFAMWLIDSHRSNPGTVTVELNDQTVDELSIPSGVTRGHLEGDSTDEDTPLRPSYLEIDLPRDHLVTGENVISLGKADGSYHVYDAVGVFEVT